MPDTGGMSFREGPASASVTLASTYLRRGGTRGQAGTAGFVGKNSGASPLEPAWAATPLRTGFVHPSAMRRATPGSRREVDLRPMNRFRAGLTAALLLLGLLLAAAASAAEASPTRSYVAKVNEARASHGLHKLTVSRSLQRSSGLLPLDAAQELFRTQLHDPREPALQPAGRGVGPDGSARPERGTGRGGVAQVPDPPLRPTQSALPVRWHWAGPRIARL